MILGIDIGGANTKAASSDGKFTMSKYLPLWKEADLEGTLRSIKEAAGDIDAVGVAITGELADCYPTKKEGIEHISSVVKKVFKNAVFYGSDGKFYRDTPDHKLFSAANWVASARYVGMVHKDILFIDIGSTTTDIIPVVGSLPAAGMTDFQRLAHNELIYAGALRTNIAALLQRVNIKDMDVRTSSELFAITGDAYLLLERITPEEYTCDTPDCGSKDSKGAALRLARVVCCDLEELDMGDVMDIARQVHTYQVDTLKEAVDELVKLHGLNKAIICGQGSFIAKDALLGMHIPFTMLSAEYGDEISKVFPAYAVARLLGNTVQD
ncbi:H4MPT-linked C1 transfer pathway protein [Methanocella sp. CWC-04]|uniref:H4MPT-linked C1 transfer pathway protein n=1 Tax=Methanooceanicella nereidis TaxID=2052831 RepID=A0AAP2RB48_9EURY|nr:hydantoinase/oxoprolinase family protein [Methanocella sp. CWC-04]MCD1293661.1 H4MPT-linked C1 transfer pathway protein [Methanocella sp. CWC-04]